jgi:hypothetical protein
LLAGNAEAVPIVKITAHHKASFSNGVSSNNQGNRLMVSKQQILNADLNAEAQ